MRDKLFVRTCSFLILATAIGVAVFAQQGQTITPSAERLRKHVTYLASDALEGRRTGSRGANDAAHYLAGEFARIGLKGAPSTRAAKTGRQRMARFLQTFPYVAGIDLGKSNRFSFWVPPPDGQPVGSAVAGSLRAGEDWMPIGLSSNGRVESASAVFAGYGITATELNYNDYGDYVSGKVAIALSGTPDGDNPHGQFARYEDVRWKAVAARNAGARALVIVAREPNFKEDRLSRLRYDNTAGDAGLPVLAISRQAMARLFPATDLANLDEESRAKRHSRAALRRISLTIVTDVARREVTAANVIGILTGSEPSLRDEAIIIGAHYDHLGRGGEGSLAAREGEIHHGADDNASGVAGVLELARILSSQRPKPRRSIIFIAFSGEEEGLLGSNYYVNHPVVPLARTTAMINMDMIGRMKANKLIIGGVGTASEWKPLIEEAQAHLGAPGSLVAGTGRDIAITDVFPRPFELTLTEDGYGPSDHSSFYAKQIPVLFFWTGTHEDYHKPSDTADRINYNDEARILSLVLKLVKAIDSSDARPTYAVARSESTGRSTGFRVYLGTIPNYADSGDGLLLDGVRDDSPAAKAGILAGDRILMLAGHDVHNIYDYTFALGEMKAGQEYEVEILRGSERMKLKITPAARK